MAASKDSTVLVTGSDGYIGAVLVEMLLIRGYRVRGLDTGYLRDTKLQPPVRPSEVLAKDIRDASEDDLADVDAVMHLAALSNDAIGELDAGLTLSINCDASVRLARLAKSAGVERFIASSSCSMYGVNAGSVADEESELSPQTSYAVSKVRMEEAISALASDSFSPVFLRNGTAYGLSPKLRMDLVLNNLVGWAMTTREIRVMSDGTPWRPLVHVEDIASAFVASLEAPREDVHNKALNVGEDRQNYQVREIAETVRHTVPNCTVTCAGESDADVRSYRVDFSKIERVLPAYRPQWTIEKGARQIHDSLVAAGLTADDFLGRRFNRLKQFQHLIGSSALRADLRWRVPLARVSKTADPL